MKNVVVLGGGGYVGRHLCERWLRAEPEVHIYSVSRRGKPATLSAELNGNERMHWVTGDALDPDSFSDKLPANIAVIIDLVGTVFARTAKEFERMNVGPVKTMITLMERLFIEHGGYVSGVMGLPLTHKAFVGSKQTAETLAKNSGKSIAIFRPSLIYGDKPQVAPMVPFVKLLGMLPGMQKFKPVAVWDLADEIIRSYKL